MLTANYIKTAFTNRTKNAIREMESSVNVGSYGESNVGLWMQKQEKTKTF